MASVIWKFLLRARNLFFLWRGNFGYRGALVWDAPAKWSRLLERLEMSVVSEVAEEGYVGSEEWGGCVGARFEGG